MRYRVTTVATVVVVLSCTTAGPCEDLCPKRWGKWISASRLSDEGLQAARDLVGLELTLGQREMRVARYAKIPAGSFKLWHEEPHVELPLTYEYAVLCEQLNPPRIVPVLEGGGVNAASFFRGWTPIPIIEDADVADLRRLAQGGQHESAASGLSVEYKAAIARLSQ